MAKHTCYQPSISRFLISALYHEGRHRRVPMTRLVDELLTTALRDTPGWLLAEDSRRERTATTQGPNPNPTPTLRD